MNNSQQKNGTLSTRLLASLGLTQDGARWESLISSLLKRLELDEKERADAQQEYLTLANEIARKLDIPRHDVDVYPQGSMRTQTTISPRGTAKFDIDVVVELSGPKYQSGDSEQMFHAFGEALKGREALTGAPIARRRCWMLNYPNKPYYFDVTPAISDPTKQYGSGLRVRDPDTRWSPSNPKEFAEWFTQAADKRFPFQMLQRADGLMEARKSIDPLPDEPVRIDDILRRSVQLMKLHRDNYYHFESEVRKDAKPISVIIGTASTQAFEDIWQSRGHTFKSPIEVVLAVVEDMPKYIKQDGTGKYQVPNPMLPKENFADRWNSDGGVRAREFKRWHAQLESNLEVLLTDNYSTSTETKLKSVFGQVGVDAWKDSVGAVTVGNSLLGSLVASSGLQPKNPSKVTPVGRKTDTLA